MCRDLQHAWSPLTALKARYVIIRTLKCARCDAEKEQTLDKSGYITSTRMRYPEGYLRKGKGRMTRDDRARLRVGNVT